LRIDKAYATALPMPLDAPVITKVFPFKINISKSLLVNKVKI
jgi:hypothetical protein